MKKTLTNTVQEANIDNNMQDQWNIVANMLGLKQKTFFGGVESCKFSVEELSSVLDMGFTKPEQKQNQAPTVETFFNFGKQAVASGAVVEYIGFLESKSRDDARLIIDGIKVTNFPESIDLILEFSQTFHGADEFTAKRDLLRAWYD